MPQLILSSIKQTILTRKLYGPLFSFGFTKCIEPESDPALHREFFAISRHPLCKAMFRVVDDCAPRLRYSTEVSPVNAEQVQGRLP